MTVSAEGGLRMRKGSILVNVLSYSLATLIIVALLLQLATIFFLVGLGPRAAGGPMMARARFDGGPSQLGVSAALIVGGIVLISALRSRRADSWSYLTALFPIPILGMVAFMTLSYRLVGLVACGVAVWAYVQHVTDRGRLRLLTYSSLIMLFASILPYDISLQNVPGPPRWVPTVAGLLDRGTNEAAVRGEVVIVGACMPMYDEPTWVWVW